MDPMVKKSHYAPRPLQQPQMPDMKQVKSSVCNHIRHFSTLSSPPRQISRALFYNVWEYLAVGGAWKKLKVRS